MHGFVSAFKAAKQLGVSGTTILKWVAEGRFPNAMVFPGAIRQTVRIPMSDIERLKRKEA